MRRFLVLAAVLALTGCATPANNYDPLERINRQVYRFNSSVDDAVLKPVAQGYVAVAPRPVRAAVTNFFGNVEDVYIGLNNLLQGKFQAASTDLSRFVFNSTLGLAGLIDIATPAGLPKHNEDLGQTLGVWGVGSGPYLVVPLLGPKTLRDSSDLLVMSRANPLSYMGGSNEQVAQYLLRGLDFRARLLAADAVLDSASLDEYAFVRNGYLQRRHNLIHDGNPPKPLRFGDDEEIDITSLDIKSP
ncbi:MlaA family lipoprotein [Chitinimonas lacunae]|uniref:VacJ family lipoprotein n=1 Tax=Chitinimonas lacunae TaxID=1963018 RepID=A0ABV8MSN9_9NEIS